GAPFLHVNVGLPDERVLPPGAHTRQVQDVLRSDFSSDEVQSIRVVATGVGDPFGSRGQIANYAAGLSRVPGVSHVDSLAGTFRSGHRTTGPTLLAARFAAPGGTWFQVVPSVDPFSKPAEKIVHTIRDSRAP